MQIPQHKFQEQLDPIIEMNDKQLCEFWTKEDDISWNLSYLSLSINAIGCGLHIGDGWSEWICLVKSCEGKGPQEMEAVRKEGRPEGAQ